MSQKVNSVKQVFINFELDAAYKKLLSSTYWKIYTELTKPNQLHDETLVLIEEQVNSALMEGDMHIVDVINLIHPDSPDCQYLLKELLPVMTPAMADNIAERSGELAKAIIEAEDREYERFVELYWGLLMKVLEETLDQMPPQYRDRVFEVCFDAKGVGVVLIEIRFYHGE
jgi:hypothetical protein